MVQYPRHQLQPHHTSARTEPELGSNAVTHPHRTPDDPTSQTQSNYYSMAHEHCDRCFLANCLQATSCPQIFCPNGCSARMHECKRADHDHICPSSIVPCLNVNFGCPLRMERAQLSRHLRVCPASLTVCSFIYNHEYQFDVPKDFNAENLVHILALRDNLWYDHMSDVQSEQKQLFPRSRTDTTQNSGKPKLIHSEKYRYITMADCMLDRGDGMMCSSCRIHLRKLEEEEDRRLAEMSEEERQQMIKFNENYDEYNSNLTSLPSLVKTSSTTLDSSVFPADEPSPSTSASHLPPDEPLPIISDMDMPYAHIYRLNYFAGDPYTTGRCTFRKMPRFDCNAICRRDEIAQHWLLHFQVDCILDRGLIEQCPRAQYGCSFQQQRLQPCRSNGDPMGIQFDRRNDALAFDWHPTVTKGDNQSFNLMDFPTELLEKILKNLDSLSLRNVSLVCRRLRVFCEQLLPLKGSVVTEYIRQPLAHGDITWLERKKHWLYTNTTSAAPQWRLTEANQSTSMSQHMITCAHGETKDLEQEPPFKLIGLTIRKVDTDERSAEENEPRPES